MLMDEKKRLKYGINLIASENCTSKSVMQLAGSVLQNKYSEGYPGARYYGGCVHIDKIENLCKQRALDTFRLDSDKWHVNVQSLSGSPANISVYTAMVAPGDKIMGLDLTCGGHLSHGFRTPKRVVSATSLFWDSAHYRINEDGFIDYDEAYELAQKFKPKVLIAGYSAYTRDLDYKRFREIADSVGAYLLCDIAHISGLIAAGEMNDPFEYADFVTTTTHKALRGPRGALIFSKKEYAQQLDDAVFPGLQGGPHNHTIGAIATTLLDAQTPEFKEYIIQVKKNAQAIANGLMNRGYKLVTNGTDNHLILLNLRAEGLTGSKVEAACNMTNLIVNKNTIAGDKSAANPGGLRLGTPAITTRGYDEQDCDQVAEFLHRIIGGCKKVQGETGKKLVNFNKGLDVDEDIKQIGNDVAEFAGKFEYPGL